MTNAIGQLLEQHKCKPNFALLRKRSYAKKGYSLRDQHDQVMSKVSENEKWDREIEIENEYSNDLLRQSYKLKRKGDVDSIGPCSWLCYWYFDIKT